MAAEVDEQLASRRGAARPRSRRSGCSPGRYDAGDALVTVNAGAGGTDAQDWAEMVLRMVMRWAERRGFKVELLEASAGRGGRHQVGDLPRGGRERLRAVRRREGRAPARAALAVRLRQPPPDRVRRRRGRAGRSRTTATSRSTTTTCRSTPTAPRAPAASTSTRPTRPCASRTARRASSCSARTSARRRRTSETAMKMLRSKLRRARASASASEEIAREKGEAQDVNFGSQIRSYVLHPYTMVKDHRTNFEMGDAQRVLDGDLDGFVRAELLRRPPSVDAGEPAASEQPTAPYLDAVVALRLPRARRASTCPATRAARAPTRACATRSATARWPSTSRRTSTASTSGRRRRPTSAPSSWPPRPTARARTWFLTNGATQGNHALVLALAPLGRARRRAAQLARLARRRARAQRRAAGVRRARVRRRARHGARRHAASRCAPRSTAAPRRRAPRSSSRRPTTGWPPTSRAAPRSPTRPASRSSSTRPGARTSASTPTLPPRALAQGADAVLTSTHKIVGSLTQSAMLHVAATGRIDVGAVARARAARALDVAVARC